MSGILLRRAFEGCGKKAVRRFILTYALTYLLPDGWHARLWKSRPLVGHFPHRSLEGIMSFARQTRKKANTSILLPCVDIPQNPSVSSSNCQSLQTAILLQNIGIRPKNSRRFKHAWLYLGLFWGVLWGLVRIHLGWLSGLLIVTDCIRVYLRLKVLGLALGWLKVYLAVIGSV